MFLLAALGISALVKRRSVHFSEDRRSTLSLKVVAQGMAQSPAKGKPHPALPFSRLCYILIDNGTNAALGPALAVLTGREFPAFGRAARDFSNISARKKSARLRRRSKFDRDPSRVASSYLAAFTERMAITCFAAAICNRYVPIGLS